MGMTNFPNGVTSFGMPVAGAGMGIKGGALWADPTEGVAGAPGTSPTTALSTVLAAYNLATAEKNDVVYFVPGDTADKPTTAFTWAKDFTHLIGLSNDLPGMGQRCRIVNDAANDLSVLYTISAHGCTFKNIQWFDSKDSAADGANVLVSGDRNSFLNCFFAGMGSLVASSPPTRAGSYSLKVTGSENYFHKCVIGLDTVLRTAANSELIITGGRNIFEDCIILSYSETAGKFLAKIDNSGGDMRWQLFKNCAFINYTANLGTGISNVFDMPASGATAYVYLQNCSLFGVGSGWADTVTSIFGDGPAPNAGFGISVTPTT